MSDPTRTPAEYAEAFTSWRTDTPVPETADARLSLELGSLRSLSSVRRQVQDFLLSSLDLDRDEDIPPAVEDVIDGAILIIDELTSNALRHGAPPPPRASTSPTRRAAGS